MIQFLTKGSLWKISFNQYLNQQARPYVDSDVASAQRMGGGSKQSCDDNILFLSYNSKYICSYFLRIIDHNI